MKRWKKLISIMLCLLFVVSMFTACRKEDADKDTNAQVPTEVPADKSDAAEPTVAPTKAPTVQPLQLTLGIWPDDSDAEGIALQESYTAEFTAAHPDITVVPARYTYSVDSFNQMAKSGALPVIFRVYEGAVHRILNSGYAADITDILKARGWLDAVNPSIEELLSKDGKIYGIPESSFALGLMINIDLFKKAGLVDEEGLPIYPRTWTELAETGKKIKDATGAAGFCLLAQDNAASWQFVNIAWAFGAELYKKNSDGTITCNLDSPEAIAAMEYVKSLKWKYDILTPDPTIENFTTGFTRLGTGEAAMYIAANDAVDQPTVYNGLPVEALSLVPMPAGPGGQYSLFDGSVFMFSKEATKEQINAALDYLTIMGEGPEIDSDAYEKDYSTKKQSGVPVIFRFPDWIAQTGLDQEKVLVDKYSNVDLRLYQDYFDILKKEGNLRREELGDQMYLELTPVIQAVIKDENADIAALLKKADENYQKVPDSTYN